MLYRNRQGVEIAFNIKSSFSMEEVYWSSADGILYTDYKVVCTEPNGKDKVELDIFKSIDAAKNLVENLYEKVTGRRF